MTTLAETTAAVAVTPTPAGPPVFLDAACNIAAFASTEPSRYVINGIHITRDYAEATDGRMLIRVPLPAVDVESFPPTSAPTEFTGNQILPVKPLQEALRSAKEAGRAASLPICSMIRISSSPAAGEKPGKLHLTTNDLENERTIAAKPIDGDYPNVDQVIPTADPTFSITLSADLLIEIAKYAIAHNDREHHPVRLDFLDNTDPVRFSIQLPDSRKATGVLMPMRMS